MGPSHGLSGRTQSPEHIARRVAATVATRRERGGWTGLKRERHPKWRGGRTTTQSGYVRVRIANGYVQEHRLVMERLLGRALRSDETVHHKNGIRSDNRPENLELRLITHHGPGQSIPDLVRFAREILSRYEGELTLIQTRTAARD